MKNVEEAEQFLLLKDDLAATRRKRYILLMTQIKMR